MAKVGVREAARILGVSHVALIKARKSGALEFEPDGQVDTDKVRTSEWGKKRWDGAAPPPDPGTRETAPPAGVPSTVEVRRQSEQDRDDQRRVVMEPEPQPHGGWLKRERATEEGEGASEDPKSKIDLEKDVLRERAERYRLENAVRSASLVDRAEVESATEARFRA